jgi:DNA-binding HxlR family transcriptional regulator
VIRNPEERAFPNKLEHPETGPGPNRAQGPELGPFVYKTEGNERETLPREDVPVASPPSPVPHAARPVDVPSLEKLFQDFGEAATDFVRQVSAMGAVSYRGEPSAVRYNVIITKKVFSKWSIEIIMSTYSLKSVGFGDLKRLLSGISSRVLSKKLKDLEELGFIDREVIQSRPPKVRYTLSKNGEVLAKLGEPVIMYLRQSMKK